MFDNKKDNELKEVYILFSKNTESLKTITEIMTPYIRERGDSIYNNKEVAKDPTSN